MIYLAILAIVFLAFFVFLTLFLQIVRVKGNSMIPTLVDMDQVLIIRHWPPRWLQNGQLAVIRSGIYNTEADSRADREILFVKRIVALPGETVRANINDLQWIEETDEMRKLDPTKEKVWKIPPKHFFVKSDFRGTDSFVLGPIPYNQLVGIVIKKITNESQLL